MENADRLTVVSIGVGIILAITAGACSTNAGIADLRADVNARFADLRVDVNARFAEAAEERREEHRRIDERLDRLATRRHPPEAGETERRVNEADAHNFRTGHIRGRGLMNLGGGTR